MWVLGEGPIKNTLQHTHEIREGTQSHCDEIMISNGGSTHKELVPAKAVGCQWEHYTIIHWSTVWCCLSHSLRSQTSGGNLILEKFLKGTKSDQLQQRQSWVHTSGDTFGLCDLKNMIICEFIENVSVASTLWFEVSSFCFSTVFIVYCLIVIVSTLPGIELSLMTWFFPTYFCTETKSKAYV